VTNAQAFLQVQKEFGSFDHYLWAFVDGKPLVDIRPRGERLPASTDLSDQISKDLKKRGFRFVGTTIIYAFCRPSGWSMITAETAFLLPKPERRPLQSSAKKKRAMEPA